MRLENTEVESINHTNPKDFSSTDSGPGIGLGTVEEASQYTVL